jgi:predicted ATPase
MDAAEKRSIRTPDQRIRVFISSTLKELQPERDAVRAAVEQLHLAAVMFELGARPHPPRQLYRSYLEQSDIFIGIYWERYGWIAPGEDLSGLEDEYRLSSSLPALIYIKEPAPDREPRLADLLAGIRDDDRTSYKTFEGPDDLSRLVVSDLATLLAERFDAATLVPAAPKRPSAEIPAPYTALVGRDDERRDVLELLASPDNRIVTLVGPGGIGKSRLAIEIAFDAAASGREVAFAALEAVSTPEQALTAIARALGVRDNGEEPLERKVAAAVQDRDLLLVVDNMEHLLPAADTLVDLVTDSPRLQLLVTSRSPLRLRAERVYGIKPLTVPAEGASDADAEAAASVRLFLQRATAVRPSFHLTAANIDDVAAICRAVDGVPLAIELAAARIRALSPREVLNRLDSALTLLVSGARDLPERQLSLSRTIQWSVDLLDEQSQRAFAALAVFAGRFSLGAAEVVLKAVGIDDAVTALESLVDASLLNHSDHGGTPTFRYLSLVHAFAGSRLVGDARENATDAWMDHYRDIAREAGSALRGGGQLEWLARLELEVEDLANVERALLDRERFDDAADFAWSLYLFLWIGGYLGVVSRWMTELMRTVDAGSAKISARSRAIALYYTNAIRFWEDLAFDPVPGMRTSRDLFEQSGEPFGAALAGVSIGLGLLARPEGPDLAGAAEDLERSLAGFRGIGDTWGEAMALVMLGRIGMATGDIPGALARFEQSLALARSQDELLGVVIAQNHRGWARFLAGDIAGASDDFAEGLDRSLMLGHDEGVAYGLEGFVGLRASEGDARGAGLLLGAARALRARKGILNPGAFEFYLIPIGALRDAGLGAELDSAIDEGRTLTVDEALTHVRG